MKRAGSMNPVFLPPLLALLPVLGLALDTRKAFGLGAAVTSTLLLTVLLFFVIRAFLPEAAHRVGFFLLALAVSIFVSRIFFAVPLERNLRLLIPLFLLLPPEFFRHRRNWNSMVKKILLASLAFWVLLVGHGALAEFAGGKMGLEFFRLPVGSYFLLGWIALGVRRQ